MNQADIERSIVQIRRLEREAAERLRAQVRVERRTIVVGGVEHTVDVKVCPTTEAMGDVTPFGSYAETIANAARRRGER